MHLWNIPVAWVPSGFELLIVLVLALLLFGRRLPEVARNLGKGVVEFKRGLKGEDENARASASASPAENASLAPPPQAPESAPPSDAVRS